MHIYVHTNLSTKFITKSRKIMGKQKLQKLRELNNCEQHISDYNFQLKTFDYRIKQLANPSVQHTCRDFK